MVNFTSNNLTYCHRDAIEMYRILKDYTTPDKIKLLTDKQAKHDSIVFYTKQLFRQAQPEDIVLFFFSGTFRQPSNQTASDNSSVGKNVLLFLSSRSNQYSQEDFF